MSTSTIFRKALRSDSLSYAERLALTEIGESLRSGAGFGRGVTAEIATLDETAARMRATVSTVAVPQQDRDVNVGPFRGGRIAGRLRVVPQTEGEVSVGVEGERTEFVTGGVAYGTAAPEGDVDFSKIVPDVVRFPATSTMLRSVFEDAQTEVIESLVNGEIDRSTDAEIIGGDGTTGAHFLGFTSNPDVPVITASGSPTDAITDAAAAVRGADFLGPITVALNAEDAASIVKDGATANAQLAILRDLFGVESFVISSLLDSGIGIVGSLAEAATLYVRSPLGLTLSDAHASNFVEGKVTALVETRLAMFTGRPTAARVVQF